MSIAWPWYKAYPRDFLEDTIGWPNELKGTYRMILDLLYMHDGQLADNPAYIIAHTGLSSKRKWSAIREELLKRGKLQLNDGYLTNYRALIETENRRKTDDKSEINDSVSNKNNDLAKTETEADSYKTPNPLQGDDAALGFTEFYEGYPKPNKRARSKAAAQWRKLDRIDQQLARAALERAAYDFAKLAKGGPTPAVFLRDRWFDRYGGIAAPPSQPDKRRLYDAVVAKGGVIGWSNFFSKGVEVRGRRIIVPSDFRRGLIAERYADVLRGAGYELSSFALDERAADGSAMAGNVRRKSAQARKTTQARKTAQACKAVTSAWPKAGPSEPDSSEPGSSEPRSAMFPAGNSPPINAQPNISAPKPLSPSFKTPTFNLPNFKIGGPA